MKILEKEVANYILAGSQTNIINPQSVTDDGVGKYLNINKKKKLDLTRLDYLSLGSNSLIRKIMI